MVGPSLFLFSRHRGGPEETVAVDDECYTQSVSRCSRRHRKSVIDQYGGTRTSCERDVTNRSRVHDEILLKEVNAHPARRTLQLDGATWR